MLWHVDVEVDKKESGGKNDGTPTLKRDIGEI